MNSDTSSEVILFLQNPEFFKICAILDRKIHTIEMLLDPIQKFCLKMAKIEGCLDWKLPKLKVAKIVNCQNWKLSTLWIAKIEKCKNWKLPELKIAKIESCQYWKLFYPGNVITTT